MARFRSAKEQFDYIKKEFFKGNELDGITGMSAEERLEFLLEKVNWALKEQDLAEWFGVLFWEEIYDDEDESRPRDSGWLENRCGWSLRRSSSRSQVASSSVWWLH